MARFKKSLSALGPLFLGVLILGACSADLNSSASDDETALTAYDLNLDGASTLTGQVAEGETSVEIANLSATQYVRQVVIDLGAHFLSSNICSGKTIFGRLGSALCPEEISAGNTLRDSGDVITLKQVHESGVCSDQADEPLPRFKTRASCEKSDINNKWVPQKLANERLVPDATKDFQKIPGADYSSEASRKAHRNTHLRKYSDPEVVASFPSSDCGATGSHEARAHNCDVMWMATLGSTSGGNNWTLISYTNGKEVWRDEKTGLLWGDYMGNTSHCRASGNKQNSGFNCSANTESWCAETGLETGVVAYAANSDEKGGMGISSDTGKVLWRLPTREDYFEALANGAFHVLPELLADNDNDYEKGFAISSVYSPNTTYAWYFTASDTGEASIYYVTRASNGVGVRCVGR